jgi:hypothetical protein
MLEFPNKKKVPYLTMSFLKKMYNFDEIQIKYEKKNLIDNL